jgi:alpha-amylase
MFSAGGSPGEVHTYFSPYKTPTDAFVTALGALLDFESKLREYVGAANEPFLFYKGSGEQNFTGTKAWSLMGIIQVIQRIDTAVIEFHNREEDFEKWATLSLRDEDLGKQLKQIRNSGIQGEELRTNLLAVAQSRLNEIKSFSSEKQIFDIRKKQTAL